MTSNILCANTVDEYEWYSLGSCRPLAGINTTGVLPAHKFGVLCFAVVLRYSTESPSNMGGHR